MQALGKHQGLCAVIPKILTTALQDISYAVRRFAVERSEPYFRQSAQLSARLLELVNDPDLRVRYQLAFSLGEWKDARIGPVLARLAIKDWAEERMQTAVLSSATGYVGQMLDTIFASLKPSPPPG